MYTHTCVCTHTPVCVHTHLYTDIDRCTLMDTKGIEGRVAGLMALEGIQVRVVGLVDPKASLSLLSLLTYIP